MQRKKLRGIIACWLLLSGTMYGTAQQAPINRCGTMQVLENALSRNPALKAGFEKSKVQLQEAVSRRLAQPSLRTTASVVYIPVVFHIVLTDPGLVTDAQIQEQLDVLNKDFAGLNADSINIPAAFKPLFGKSTIQFKLAQRTPDNQPANGIVRRTTNRNAFSILNDAVKFSVYGGDDAWDPARYMNVWICNLSDGILGYATPPGATLPASQGIVILYSSLPGGAAAPFNKGRTLTHETGHYFFLYHIWGDDDGSCSGSDFVNDTPNQSDATFGCPGGAVQTDNCTASAPGILYQDFMDYTDDACLLMFTHQQAARMEAALDVYRTSLLTSNGGEPPVLKSLDAAITAHDAMPKRVCDATFAPVVTLRNKGAQTITAASVSVSVDGAPAVVSRWNGSVQSLATVPAYLNDITVTAGRHTITITLSLPNDSADMDASNNTLTYVVEYHPPVALPQAEDFENTVFPPPGWDVVNPDQSNTWQAVNGIAKTGNRSVMIANYTNLQYDQKDYLRLPQLDIVNVDSAFLSFEVAAAARTNSGTFNIVYDTLEVLASRDCGKTYTSLYKKWGATLYTQPVPISQSFIPAAGEWRKDSVNLTPYINTGPVMLAFLNTSEQGNNIYLDDIRVYKKAAVHPNLRAKGWLVTPNPVSDLVTVQFYPAPAHLKSIAIYNSMGQKMTEKIIHANTGVAANYQFNCSGYARGVYIVQIVLGDKMISQKIIKQ